MQADRRNLSVICSRLSVSSKLVDDVGKFALYMLFLGIGTLLLIYTFITCFNTVSENQVHRVRKLYLQALLRQNVAWYDTVTDKNFVSRIAE